MALFARLFGRNGRALSTAWSGGGYEPHGILDLPLLWLTEEDAFTVRQACQGVLIVGGVGSGKTSGSGAALAREFLQAGFGGLVLTAKPDEAATWQRYCQETGRSDDLVLLRPRGPWRFNFLDHELNHDGEGAGLVENAVQLFRKANEITGRSTKNAKSDPFWENASDELLRNAITLLFMAEGRVALGDMLRVIASAPQTPEEAAARPWQQETPCGLALAIARDNTKDDPYRLNDFELTEEYWLRTFPRLAEKTRSVVVSSFTAMADPLLRNPMAELFCGDTTITPEASFAGKVIVLDLSIKQFGEVGRYAQVLFKLCWQRAAERRIAAQNPFPAFLFADESQFFVGLSDVDFLTTARSAAICTVFLTQNVNNYYAAFGDATSAADSVLGNLSTKVFHANADAQTNEWASRLIAQTWQQKLTVSGGSSAGERMGSASENRGYSMGEQLVAQVLPEAFIRLRTGGPENEGCVDAIAFRSGQPWRSTGKSYLPVTFGQR